MNESLKEILINLNNCAYHDLNYFSIDKESSKLLLEYISALQETNDDLVSCINTLQDVIDDLESEDW